MPVYYEAKKVKFFNNFFFIETKQIGPLGVFVGNVFFCSSIIKLTVLFKINL